MDEISQHASVDKIESEALVWNIHDVSDQRLRTEDVKLLIKGIIDDAEEKDIKINCYVSDSAGEYAVA
ncbi:1665_t:CDS:2, partial [Ambispora gerdemannii]